MSLLVHLHGNCIIVFWVENCQGIYITLPKSGFFIRFLDGCSRVTSDWSRFLLLWFTDIQSLDYFVINILPWASKQEFGWRVCFLFFSNQIFLAILLSQSSQIYLRTHQCRVIFALAQNHLQMWLHSSVLILVWCPLQCWKCTWISSSSFCNIAKWSFSTATERSLYHI